MKDIVIKAKHIRREGLVFLGCFVAACLLNAVAIMIYERPWSEMYSQIGYVFFVTVGIYFIQAVLRILIYMLINIFKTK